MKKIAFIFPGQGAQYIGMGKDFYENSETAKKIFDKASETIGLDLCKLCFEENEDIHIIEFTQVAMLTTSIAMMEVLKEKGIHPDVSAGLSLGEYCALVASGALSFEDAVRVVRKRGIYMQEEVPAGVGGMAAILGLDEGKIQQVLEELEGVQIANYNCPGQIVISGYKEAIEKALVKCKEAGARRALMLNVSGPFHSNLLIGAGEKLKHELKQCEIMPLVVPYVSNVTADYVVEKNEICSLLVQQVSSSVRWHQSMERMMKDGVDTFVEIGPGDTLSGFLEKISKEITVYNVETFEDIEKITEILTKKD